MRARFQLSFLLLAVACAARVGPAQSDAERTAIVSVTRTWDRAGHAAFTGLALWHGRLWCAFREASGHVPGTNGVVRVLTSDDGEGWRSAVVFDEVGVDLRDPKLSVTPDGRLMVWMGGSVYRGRERVAMSPRVAFGDADEHFGALARPRFESASAQDWLWRVTWQGDTAYGALMQLDGATSVLHLMASSDGLDWRRVTTWALDGRPNETTLRFLPDGRMVALVRREAGDRTGRIGVAAAPFTDWRWSALPARLGGPELLVVDREGAEPVLLAGTREYGDETRTIVARVALDGGFARLLTLPSGGDTSYPGFVVVGSRLAVSYYASHEGRSAIYFAWLRLPELLAL